MHDHGRGGDEHHQHRPQHGVPLSGIADRPAKRQTQRGGDQQHRQHLHEVRQRRRILERMRRVGVKQPSAVDAEHFDSFLRRDGSHRQRLLHPLKRSEGQIRAEVLRYALTDHQ